MTPYSEETLCEICTRKRDKALNYNWEWNNKWGFLIEEVAPNDPMVEGKCDVGYCTKRPKFIINVGSKSIQLCFTCICSLEALFAFRLWESQNYGKKRT